MFEVLKYTGAMLHWSSFLWLPGWARLVSEQGCLPCPIVRVRIVQPCLIGLVSFALFAAYAASLPATNVITSAQDFQIVALLTGQASSTPRGRSALEGPTWDTWSIKRARRTSFSATRLPAKPAQARAVPIDVTT